MTGQPIVLGRGILERNGIIKKNHDAIPIEVFQCSLVSRNEVPHEPMVVTKHGHHFHVVLNTYHVPWRPKTSRVVALEVGGEVGSSATEHAPDHGLKIAESILLHRLAEFANMSPNPRQIPSLAMQDEQATSC